MTDHTYRIRCSYGRYDTGTYAWTCRCGLTGSGLICKKYAIDDWRESHGLEPIYSYPVA